MKLEIVVQVMGHDEANNFGIQFKNTMEFNPDLKRTIIGQCYSKLARAQ